MTFPSFFFLLFFCFIFCFTNKEKSIANSNTTTALDLSFATSRSCILVIGFFPWLLHCHSLRHAALLTPDQPLKSWRRPIHTHQSKRSFFFGEKNTHCNNIDECGFAWELEADKRQLHLLFPEDALEPVQNPVDKRQHLYSVLLIAFSFFLANKWRMRNSSDIVSEQM